MTVVSHVSKPRLDGCVVYKGKRYSVAKLQKQSGPILELTAGQIHLETNSMVEGTREVLYADYSLPIVNKFDGLYVVVLGRKAFEDAIVNKQPVKCKLVSNISLKNAIIQ